MAENILRRLDRQHRAEPSKESQVRLLQVQQRFGVSSLSKNKIRVLANLGIEPIVTGFLDGPPQPFWGDDMESESLDGPVIYSYQCREGVSARRGCWNPYPHHHTVERTDIDSKHRIIRSKVCESENPKFSNPVRIPATVGWCNLWMGSDSLRWLAARIEKQLGWRACILIVDMLLCDTLGKAKTPAQKQVFDLLAEATLAAKEGSANAIAQVKTRARGTRTDLVNEFWEFPYDQSLSRTSASEILFSFIMSLIEWNRAVRVDTLTMAADTLARGVESPWCRKIIKDANRNGARNVSPTNRHLAHIVMYFHHHNLLRPAQIHHVMQDSLFQHFTGMQLIR